MKYIIYALVAVILLLGIAFALSNIPSKSGKYDDFASCINNSGAKFWGAFWCSHCAEQKNIFGKSAKLLPYTECSTPDARNQTKVCADAGITSYPAWDFPGKERQFGVQSLESLSEFTACPLPNKQ